MSPDDIAKNVIQNTMAHGSKKDGCDDSWQEKSIAYHLTRAIRHFTSALMIHMGVVGPDEDGLTGHMKNGMTRAAMALWKMTLH